jgi:hypothetical protein
MGSKQNPNSTISTEGINTKQIITSGMAPNRLLIKAFKRKLLILKVQSLKVKT